ncbi:MAG: hypothetical protein V1688_00615 [bacterium]
MKFLTNKRRDKLSDAFFGLANLILGALVLGQFVKEETINFATFVLGLILSVLCYLVALFIIKDNQNI